MSEAPVFFPGLHHPADACHFDRACLSINVLRGRCRPIACRDILLDSGAFTELAGHGRYREAPSAYAAEIRRLHDAGVVSISAAVAQDWMCEPFMLSKTGLTTADHQRLTIERYDALIAARLPVQVMPVLQGYAPSEYVAHLMAYGKRIAPGQWVGVGSVCKRNGQPERIVEVLDAVLSAMNLKLHGFGVKSTALRHPGVRSMLHTADSMAWSDAARKVAHRHIRALERAWGRKVKPAEARAHYDAIGVRCPNPNDWRLARRFAEHVQSIAITAAEPWQIPLFEGLAA